MKRMHYAVLLVVMLFVTACVLPLPGSTVPTETAKPIEPEPVLQTATIPQATETMVPVPTEEPTLAPTQPAGNLLEYKGIRFYYDPALAAGVSAEVVPASEGNEDSPFWDIYPEYRRVTFQDYIHADKFHKPQIEIYPVAEYRQMSEGADQTITDLENYLETMPADVENIPFLPRWNAGQVFHSNVEYLDFENGSGVRFLSLYAQYYAPINNHDLFYTFQGLTTDGKYAISFVLPVANPELPETSEPQGDWDEFIDNYPTYITEMQALLEGSEDGEFTPDLQLLDAMVRSLLVVDYQ